MEGHFSKTARAMGAPCGFEGPISRSVVQYRQEDGGDGEFPQTLPARHRPLAHDRFGIGSSERWVAVAPADGSAVLALVTPKPGSEEYNLIGRSKQIVFVTEDVPAKFRDWCDRGIQFRHPPHTPEWGGTFTSFEDVDGNSFVLVGFDEVSREIEAQRHAIEEKLESERRSAQELEIAKKVQARLFPQVLPPLETLDYAGACKGPSSRRRLLRSRSISASAGGWRHCREGYRGCSFDG